MCFEDDMSHIDSKPRIHRPRADQASQTGGGQTQFLKEGMAADADQRGDGENRQIIHTNTHKRVSVIPQQHSAKNTFGKKPFDKKYSEI